MTLPRKDVRAWLDADMHEALCVLADVDHLELKEFIERELVRVIKDRVHGAIETSARTAHLGINGIQREFAGLSAGKPRK